MNILMPLTKGRFIHSDVIAGIAMQTIQCNVFAHCSEKEFPTVYGRNRGHEAENRNVLKQYACNSYTMLMNMDIILTSNHDVEDLIKGLDTMPDIEALALDTKGLCEKGIEKHERNGHVVMACMIIRSDVLKNITFRQLDDRSCLCKALNIDCKIKYLDGRHLGEVK